MNRQGWVGVLCVLLLTACSESGTEQVSAPANDINHEATGPIDQATEQANTPAKTALALKHCLPGCQTG